MTRISSGKNILQYRNIILSGILSLLLTLGVAAALLFPDRAHAGDLTCSHLPSVMEAFHQHHYAMKTTTGAIRTQAVDQMIKRLDPSKTLFYEADLGKIRPLLMDVFVGMKNGSCASLAPVYDLLVARARENEALVRKIIGPDFRVDRSLELVISADKRPYAKTQAEKRDILEKMLHFQIENALLSGIDPAEARKRQIHRYELQTRRIVEQTPDALITRFAEAFAQSLDPHTAYLPPKDLEDLKINMQLSLEGIGAVLSSDNGFTIIEELIPGGGAEKSGLLQPKDRIIAVAQEGEKPVDVIDMDLRDVVSMIRGKKGTEVTLTILRQGDRKERFNVAIVRDKIDMTEQEAKITYETRTVNGKSYRFGILDLPSFYGGETGGKSSSADVKKLLAQASKQKVDGMVLNLSRNNGGLLDEAVRVAGLFLGKGSVVAVKDSRGRTTTLANGSVATGLQRFRTDIVQYSEEEPDALYLGPLVVLTSRLSASASEIVAGALQDYRRAMIVGADHTFGKGSVQTLMQLPWELGAMKVTTGLYFLPGGKSTQKTGVAADIVLPGWSGFDDMGEAALDYPLPAQTIAPFLTAPDKNRPRYRPLDENLIAALAAKSRTRVDKDEKFAEIIRNSKEAADMKGLVRITDLRKPGNRENESAETKTRAEQRQKAIEQYAPFIEESVNVLLDMVKTLPREGRAESENGRAVNMNPC